MNIFCSVCKINMFFFLLKYNFFSLFSILRIPLICHFILLWVYCYGSRNLHIRYCFNRSLQRGATWILMGATWFLPPSGNLIFLGVVKACTPWLPILGIHIRSQVKTRQSQSYTIKKNAKNSNLAILQDTLHATHLLKLLDKMCKYENEYNQNCRHYTADTGCGTGGRTDRQTDRWTDRWSENNIPPNNFIVKRVWLLFLVQLICSGCDTIQMIIHYLNQCWQSSMMLYGITRPQRVKWIGNMIVFHEQHVSAYCKS